MIQRWPGNRTAKLERLFAVPEAVNEKTFRAWSSACPLLGSGSLVQEPRAMQSPVSLLSIAAS